MTITFPSVLSHPDAEVFPDTEDINLYYLVPNVPRLRIDGEVPVFRGLFWANRLNGSSPSPGGLGGALLNFDVDLSIPEETQDEIRKQLVSSGVQQQRQADLLREERERADRMARATGSAPVAPAVQAVGPIRFGSIQYLDGNVTLLVEKDGDFVEWSSAGGPPSLMGTNNSAFALRLGGDAAEIWYRGLEQDATAIGVRYELKFQVMLPSLDIHVWAGSHEHLEIERKAERVIESVDQGCEDADVERIDVKEVTERLQQEGLIHIDIQKGTAKVSDEHVAQLREMALNLISERVKQIMMSRIRGMTEEERRNGLHQKVTEDIRAFAELRLSQRDVVEWKVNPQATLTEFLGGITGEERKRLVTLVDLANPVVATVEAPVTVNAPWDGDPGISKVDIAVIYPAAPFEDEKVKEVSLDKATPQTTLRWRRNRGDKGMLEYVARAYVKGQRDPVEIAKGTTNGPIHVEVPEIGKLALEARPFGDDFGLKGSGKITAVQLDYEYGKAGERDHVANRIVLRGEDAAAGREIAHRISGHINGPVRIVPTYLREDGAPITGEEINAYARPGEVFRVDVPSAWPDKLRVGARVRPGIPGLEQVLVHVEHADEATGFESDATILLDEDGEWSGSNVLAQADAGNQRFRYRYSVQGADQLEQSPWVDAEGDGELPLLPVQAVRIRGLNRLGLGDRFSDAILRLTYTDESRNWEISHEMFLDDPAAEPVWLVPRVSPQLNAFRYSLSLTTMDGDVVDVPETGGSGENLVLRAPR
ncbi:MAG TPA: hypothetical protein VN213_16925 [Solirubrobacteraceae bacterium]|nr:hypothetical protein [Solirubrobacteraceae bacterium]